MNNSTIKLNNILEKYGYQNSLLFQQKFDEFLTKVDLDRKTVYNMMISIQNSHLSAENSDYLDDVVADIRGHTAKIFYKFKDDPMISDDKLLAYVRSNLWKNN